MSDIACIRNEDEDEEKEEKQDESMMMKMLKSRTVTLFEPVMPKSSRAVIQSLFLLEQEDPDAPIYLYVNSPGGDVNSGFAIYDVIRFIKPEVKIICSGLCASIATVILMAAKKKNRISLPNSRFLIHQPLISGQVYGQASDIEITANQIILTREKINLLLSKETGQELARVSIDTERDYWMSAEETLDYGLISSIIKSRSELV